MQAIERQRTNPAVFKTVPVRYKWSVKDFYRLEDLGFFDGKKVELIRGEIIELEPMKSPHATSVQLVSDALLKVFKKDASVRQQLPLALSKQNEPLPDIAVVTGSVRDYSEAHPKSALLVVEIAETTLLYDRTTKAEIYAQAGISEYWILNLKERTVEAYRNPSKNGSRKYYYAEQTIYREDQFISPLAMPKAKLKVAEFLP